MSAREYCSREEWARQRRTFYYDIADQAADSVSFAIGDYATEEEIEHAASELRARWTAVGRELRTANTEAKAVFPQHGQRNNWRDYFELSDEAREIVDRARTVQGDRQHLNDAVKMLRPSRDRTPYFDHYTTGRVTNTSAETCPTYTEIVGRWHAARAAAVEKARLRTENLPIDDAAWEKELDRRAELDRYFRDGPVVTRHAAAGWRP